MPWFLECKSTKCRLSPEADSLVELESWWTSGKALGYRMLVRYRSPTEQEVAVNDAAEVRELLRLMTVQFIGQGSTGIFPRR